MAVHLLRLIVAEGLRAPSQLAAAKPGHQWFLPATPCVSGFQPLEGAVGRWHRRPVLPEDLARAGAVLSRAGKDQGELHDAVDLPQAVGMIGEPVGRDDAPVCRLVLRHEAVSRLVAAGRPLDCLASPQVLGALRAADFSGNLQAGYAVEAASVLGPTLLLVGVLMDDVVAEAARGLRPGVRDQGLLG
jgi:hypothetical protein